MRLEERVNSYGSFLKKRYGCRVFRVGISFGLNCLHREKNKGCIFCLPETFSQEESRAFCGKPDEIGINQLELIIPRVKRGIGLKEHDVGAFLAYFQSGLPAVVDNNELEKLLIKTASYPGIKGIIIASKPGHLREDTIRMLKDLPTDTFLEIGMQTSHQISLDFLNREQTITEMESALELCLKYGIRTGVHLIIGIPGETSEDICATIDYVNDKKIITEVKLHNLVVYQGTALEGYPKNILDSIPCLDKYLKILGMIILRLRKDIVISRFFTSNVKGNNKALNPFLGVKRDWINSLVKYLNDNDIVQGTNSVVRS